MNQVESTVKDYILTEFLPGTQAAELTETTPLVTGAILDSLATLRLVAFLEERFGIEIAPHEASVEHMNTIQDIASLVRSKA
jgi:acyl carrier protein